MAALLCGCVLMIWAVVWEELVKKKAKVKNESVRRNIRLQDRRRRRKRCGVRLERF